MSFFEPVFIGVWGDFGSRNSLETGCFIEGLRLIEANGSSIDFLSLLREKEFPLVDLRLPKPLSWLN